MDRAARYLAEDVVFDRPLGHVSRKKASIESPNGNVQALAVTGVRVLAAFGDDTQA